MSKRKQGQRARVRAADRPNDDVSAELSAATGLPWRNYGGVWKVTPRGPSNGPRRHYCLRPDRTTATERYTLTCEDAYFRDLAEHHGALAEIIAQVLRLELHGLNLEIPPLRA